MTAIPTARHDNPLLEFVATMPRFDDAACRDTDPEIFYAIDDDTQTEALVACARCTVRDACRRLGANEKWGIWGGMTAKERGYDKAGNRRKRR